MDKKQFAAVQNAVRAVAAEAVVAWQIGVIRKLLAPHEAETRSIILKAMQIQLEEAKDHYRSVAIQGLPPEQSDLVAGEFQEAFDKLVSEVKQKLGIP